MIQWKTPQKNMAEKYSVTIQIFAIQFENSSLHIVKPGVMKIFKF